MNSRRLVVGLTFFALMGGFALGWVANAASKPAVLLVTPVTAADLSLSAARAQLEQQSRNDDRLVSVVTSSISVVLTITIGLAAFSWYTSNTTFDRELASLKMDVERLVSEATRKLTTDLATQMTALEKQQLQKAAQIAGQAAKDGISPVEERLVYLEDLVYEAEANRLVTEAANEATNGHLAMAFRAYLKALRSLARTRFGWIDYPVSIDGLHELVVKAGYKPTAERLGEFEECIKAIDRSIDNAKLRPAVERLVAAVRG